MKTLFCIALFLGIAGFSSVGVFAQCDRSTQSPIRCGFYDEGYQDGANDARNNQNSDYRRYRSKLTSQYESYYRDGYDAGYRSARGGDYPGYPGYPGNPGTPGFPGPGNASGSVYWTGRVDDRINIVLKGPTIRTDVVSGQGSGDVDRNSTARLPRRAVTLSVSKLDGRGDVTVVQQPNRSNDFTGIVQIYDPKGGADNYRVQISWQGGSRSEEPYQSGNVRWSGRVDQTANIVISGSDVDTQNVSGNGVSNVNFNINGYLAHRPGTVNVRKRDGRGTVTVLQQPSRANDYTAVIQVFDPDGGADNYDLEISW
jgi:hypothetical protein